jgi:hypothetical protein
VSLFFPTKPNATNGTGSLKAPAASWMETLEDAAVLGKSQKQKSGGADQNSESTNK